jgi:pyruvate dehydrogenase E1 component alpha subunit
LHIADPSLGILGANGIVGAGIPLATGAGMTAKLKQTGQVAVSFFGDGASNQGTFHEAINIASAFDLPVVYVCENNLYGVGTRQGDVRKIEDVADRGVAYGIPGVVVDGNDVLAVYEAASEAVRRARNGEGPTLIEGKTYRWRTHFEGETDTYRPPEEVEMWLKREPIAPFRQHLIELGILTEAEADELEQDVIKAVDAAVEFGRQSPDPALESALEDVWA